MIRKSSVPRVPSLSKALGLTTALLFSSVLDASAQTEAVARDLENLEGQVHRLVSEPLDVAQRRSPTYVEERIADGELYFRLRDYARSSIIFSDVVRNHPNHRAYPDALFLLADSLFRAGDYLGARTHFRALVDRSNDPLFRSYVPQALGRLIEVAIHTRDFAGMDDIFARLNQLPPAEVAASTSYFRAKYIFSQAVPVDDIVHRTAQAIATGVDLTRIEQAREAFAAIGLGQPYYAQAQYFVGVIHTLREQYPEAIQSFTAASQNADDSEEGRSVVELSQLALGRLYYETDRLDAAITAYQSVSRASTNFDVALYEIAWVHIRRGDGVRAERALEVLGIASPDSRYIPDAKLLRGNLLLRNGRHEEANTVFREVATEFGPIRRELDDLIATHDREPIAYFRELVRTNLEAFDANAFLPASAQRWVSLDGGDFNRAVTAVSDLSTARRMIQETGDLVARLEAAISQPNRVAVFADLRRQRQTSTLLRNQLSNLRRTLIDQESSSSSGGSPELLEVRSRRREIERFLDELPTRDEDVSRMDDAILGNYRELSREIGRIEVELSGVEARVTALTQYAENPSRLTGDRTAFLSELQRQRASVSAYRRELNELRVQLEASRLQVGVGDDRYVRQQRLRAEYDQLVERERALGGNSSPNNEALFRRINTAHGSLDRRDSEIDVVVDRRVADIRVQLNEETVRLAQYRSALAQLDTETEEVVGTVAYVNYRQVQRRFYDLVLRADVGRVDVGWAQREEHRLRVEMLSRERTREIRGLDDEFREISDEGQSSSQTSEESN